MSTTGVAGFTLGGGIGWLVRRAGLACDNLVGADIVTADGRYLHTSETENPELLWALRGGGGNFGVVTSFEFKAHEVGPTVFAGLVFYPGDQAANVLRGFSTAAAGAPDELSLAINLTTAPPLPFLPEEVHGKPIVAVLGMWSGQTEDGDAATKPFRELAPVVADLFGPMPYVAMQTLLDPLYPRGMWNYFRSAFFADLGEPRPSTRSSRRTPRCRTVCPSSMSTTSGVRWAGCRPTPPRSGPATASSSSTWSRGLPTRMASTPPSSGPGRRRPRSDRTRRRT